MTRLHTAFALIISGLSLAFAVVGDAYSAITFPIISLFIGKTDRHEAHTAYYAMTVLFMFSCGYATWFDCGMS